MQKNDFSSYATIVGALDEEGIFDSLPQILEGTVSDFNEEELRHINLNGSPKENFKFSPGQKLALKAILKLIQKIEGGAEPMLFREITGKFPPGTILIDGNGNEFPQAPTREIPPTTRPTRPAVLITPENAEVSLIAFLSKKFGITINNIEVTRRSTSSYPFKLQIKCIFCDNDCHARVIKEKKGGKEFTRFRAESLIKHIQQSHPTLINESPA